MASSIHEDIESYSEHDGAISECGNDANISRTQGSSTIHNGSISSRELRPDKYGFLGGKQYTQPELFVFFLPSFMFS